MYSAYVLRQLHASWRHRVMWTSSLGISEALSLYVLQSLIDRRTYNRTHHSSEAILLRPNQLAPFADIT